MADTPGRGVKVRSKKSIFFSIVLIGTEERNCCKKLHSKILIQRRSLLLRRGLPLGRSFTATQERAGFPVKYFAYTALNAAKSAISARKQVVFTTSVNAAF